MRAARVEVGGSTRYGTAAPAWSINRTVVDEADGYSRSVKGVEIEAVRVGLGNGPCYIDTIRHEAFTYSSCEIGFPMATQTATDDHRVILAQIHDAEPGSRWCEIDLEPGMVLIYGPAAEHAAINQPGLRFSFTIAQTERIRRTADWLGTRIEIPSPGQVRVISQPQRTRSLEAAFSRARDFDPQPPAAGEGLVNSMLEAMVDTLTDPDFDPPLHTNHRIDSRIIVRACTEYAMAIGRVPSIGELRRSAHVSERRLREAFLDLFGMPPTRYFRAWGLNQVHSRLVESNPGSRSVTQVASSVGFTHLGRFAAQYRQVYGEVPSHTLRR